MCMAVILLILSMYLYDHGIGRSFETLDGLRS